MIALSVDYICTGSQAKHMGKATDFSGGIGFVQEVVGESDGARGANHDRRRHEVRGSADQNSVDQSQQVGQGESVGVEG